MTARYLVAENTQVNYNGTVHIGGEEITVDEFTVAPWLEAGYVTPVTDEPVEKLSRRKATVK